MNLHYVINEAALDALHKHSRQPSPRVRLSAPLPVIRHAPREYDYDMPRSEYFVIGETRR